MTASYTLESVIACTAVPVLVLALAVLAAYMIMRWRRGADSEFLFFGVASAVLAVVASAGLWWGMYPWKSEYHQWRPVSGTVATVDSRLTTNANNGGMEDKFVVTFVDSAQQYGVLDTRAASLRPGDRVDLTCVRRWQWSGSHGFDCNFIEMSRSAR